MLPLGQTQDKPIGEHFEKTSDPMYRRDFTLSAVAALLFRLHCPNILLSQIPSEDKSVTSPKHELAGPAEGPWRRLFLDATIVEEQQGLTRQFHSA